MLDQTVAQAVVDQLKGALASGAEFTAYDVTMATRAVVGPTVDVPHSDVRAIVREAMVDLIQSGEATGVLKPSQGGRVATHYQATPQLLAQIAQANVGAPSASDDGSGI